MHAAVIFGWSSISQIIKENDFFLSQDTLAKRSSRTVPLESSVSHTTAPESCFAVSDAEGTQSKEHGSTDLCDKGEIFEGLSKDSRAFLDPLEVNFINYDTCNKFIRIVNVDSWAFTTLCFKWSCSYGNVFLPQASFFDLCLSKV